MQKLDQMRLNYANFCEDPNIPKPAHDWTKEVKEFAVWCDQHQVFLSEAQKTLDQRREENQQSQTNPEEVEAEIAEAEKEV